MTSRLMTVVTRLCRRALFVRQAGSKTDQGRSCSLARGTTALPLASRKSFLLRAPVVVPLWAFPSGLGWSRYN
jgi:hypothetical protein